MKLQLFVSPSFTPCHDAERVWSSVATEAGIDFTVIDVNSNEGQAKAETLRLSMVPALVADGCLLAVGVPTIDEGRKLLRARTRI